jgi:hypothetical protein
MNVYCRYAFQYRTVDGYENYIYANAEVYDFKTGQM